MRTFTEAIRHTPCWTAAPLSLFILIGLSTKLSAADVWVQFGTEFETQLDAAATAAGVSGFTPSELEQVKTKIFTELNRVYDGYNLDFTTTDPGGTREILELRPNRSGTEPGHTRRSPRSTSAIALEQVILLEFSPRSLVFISRAVIRVATQIHEIGMGLASSGAHEVLHTLGGRHGNVYSAVGITPANYANTGGLQANQVMSSGLTGGNETIKEIGRNLSPWSKVVLDVAGGHAVGGTPVVGTPVMSMLERARCRGFDCDSDPDTFLRWVKRPGS